MSRREAFRRLGFMGGAAFLASLSAPSARAAGTAASSGSAAELPGKQPGHYRFKIGSFEAWAINDGEFALPLAQSPFALGEPQAEVEKVLNQALLPPDSVRLSINVLLVRTSTDLILVDTGSGALFGPAGGRVVANLAAAGIRPEQVTAVVITHLHGDHFGGLYDGATQEPVFKNARFILSRREHDFWMDHPDLATARRTAEEREASIRSAQKAVNGLKGKWELVSPKDRLIEGVEFIDAPGHTAGHMTVAFSSGSDQLINFADIAHHHAISFAHPEWLLAYDVDPETAAQTRLRLYDRLATDRARVFGVHMPFPALGRIRSLGSAHYEFVSEPWQLGSYG